MHSKKKAHTVSHTHYTCEELSGVTIVKLINLLAIAILVDMSWSFNKDKKNILHDLLDII